jgi:hypothetical protein
MNFQFGETVTVYRPAKGDRTGDPATAPAPHDIQNCAIGWGNTTENHEQRETVLAWVQMYCPPGSDIKNSDRVKLPNGRTYTVDGDPVTWRSPYTGKQPGMVVRLKGVF